MPGMVFHLYCAKRTLEKSYERWRVGLEGLHEPENLIQNKKDFILGSILPDFAKNKESVHHYPNASKDFFVPDLEAARSRYSRLSNRYLKYGCLCHLALDERYTKEFIAPRFEYDPKLEIVTQRSNPENHWTLRKFFSYDGLYRAYAEMNPLVFERGLLDLDWLKENIPNEFPRTGFSTLDDRTTDNWFEFLEGRLASPPGYTGALFSFDELIEFIEMVADDFVDQDYFRLFESCSPETTSSGPAIGAGDTKPASSGPVVRIGDTEFPWEVLREGIIEIILDNPKVSPEKHAMVIELAKRICEAYQTYHGLSPISPRPKVGFSVDGAPDLINQLVFDGAKKVQDNSANLIFGALRRLYDPDFPEHLSQAYDALDSCDRRRFNEDILYVTQVENLLVALAAASGEFYRLVVSFSTF